jgi:hypothetical protein
MDAELDKVHSLENVHVLYQSEICTHEHGLKAMQPVAYRALRGLKMQKGYSETAANKLEHMGFKDRRVMMRGSLIPNIVRKILM